MKHQHMFSKQQIDAMVRKYASGLRGRKDVRDKKVAVIRYRKGLEKQTKH